MLQTLRIRNYALIDDLEVDFRPGFNVLTGETGAGKSIVIGALNLVLGARASTEVVRTGAARAKIDAVFLITQPSSALAELLEKHELEPEGDEILLSRIVNAEGRSKAYACGNLVPVSVLAALGDELVDLHGQHEHQSLLKPYRQLGLLDAYGGCTEDRRHLSGLVAELRENRKRLDALDQDDRERTRRLDFLRFEVEEIEKAQLVAGEEEEVRSRLNLITNAEKIHSLASSSYGRLFDAQDGTSASDQISRALSEVEELAEIDESFAELARRLEDVRAEVESASELLRAFSQELDYDAAELDRLNVRLTLIRDLARKYGENIEAILAYREKAASEIDIMDNRDRVIDELTAACEKCKEEAEHSARKLSKKRRSAAKKLDKEVTNGLHGLAMEGGRFETRIEDGELSSSGMDKVTFLISANPGEKPKPMRQVASGGEISRIMLALKSVFAAADAIPTLIFDEIDSGIGGAVASKVSAELCALSASHQTICITHLPQIAAAASTHYFVSKTTSNGQTQTHVTPVVDTARIEEVARLLDGSLSEVSLEHARSLLSE